MHSPLNVPSEWSLGIPVGPRYRLARTAAQCDFSFSFFFFDSGVLFRLFVIPSPLCLVQMGLRGVAAVERVFELWCVAHF